MKTLCGFLIIIIMGCIGFVLLYPEPFENIRAKLKSIPLSEIIANPGMFDGETVTIQGSVSSVVDIPLVSKDFYKIYDGTGEVWVMTNTGVPPEGAELNLKGLVSYGKEQVGPFQIEGIIIQQVEVSMR